MELVIAKFGGTSVANYAAICRCVDITLNNHNIKVVVVSAASGVTNLLIKLTKPIDEAERSLLIQEIKTIQHNILSHFTKYPEFNQLSFNISAILEHIFTLSCNLGLKQSLEKVDELLSLGEKLSALFFDAELRLRGKRSQFFDVTQILRTDSQFGKAEPQIEIIANLTAKKLKPLLIDNIIVTQGFIGADENGNTTTLGRGGSDYSAALIAEALNADALEIWTDVAGIYTTDPRIVPQAKAIPEISFNEAAEMATFGAKVLHPATILPALRKQIKVFVGSSMEPDKGGTWIKNNTTLTPKYRAITLRRDQTLISLHSLNMLHAQGFLAQTFTTLAKHKISIDLITTSEVNVAITLDKTGSDKLLTESLLQELSTTAEVKIEDKLALVAIIGNNIWHSKGICSEIFNLLSQYNIRMICQGASSYNLCMLVAENDAQEIVKLLHSKLF